MVFTWGRLNHLIVALKRVQGLILKHSGLSTRNWAFSSISQRTVLMRDLSKNLQN